MATLSGNTTTISSSASEGNGNATTTTTTTTMADERKRKRMESNRESARRSRMRKQQLVEDLTAEISRLKIENHKVGETINVTNQQLMNVEADNSVLRAQMNELSQRLDSLNAIINDINTLGGLGFFQEDLGVMQGYFGNFINDDINVCNIINNNNSWNSGFLNQPIMASADVLQY